MKPTPATSASDATAPSVEGTAAVPPKPLAAQSVAGRLVPLAEKALGGPLPVRVRAWDGSEAGPEGAPTVVIRRRRALRRLLWQPGELGLAEAYLTGDLDIEGDLAEGLQLMWRAVREQRLHAPRFSASDLARMAAAAVRLRAVGPRPPAPAARARLGGRLHSRGRDRAAISHHYDLSNDFYRLLLDETMAYSCGYWTASSEDCTGADAQRAKLDLICRKLDLGPERHLLDIGCGWGSLTLYAATVLGARVTAVTLSEEQAAYVREQVRARGLTGLVDVECRHWRDITGTGYDAVATVEMGEHVGDAEYPVFAAALYRHVRPRGRVLVQQMSRGTVAPGGGAFIESYIAPDMHMRPLGDTVTLLEAGGLEVRSVQSLREHYVRTVGVWHRTLEDRWAQFVGIVGEETARVWRLYLVGGALAFAEGRMGVDQILAVRRDENGASAMPATPADWICHSGAGQAAGPAPGAAAAAAAGDSTGRDVPAPRTRTDIDTADSR